MHRYQQATAEVRDADRALFAYRCECGHEWTSVLKIGPTGRRKPASAAAVRLMAKTWKGYGRVNVICPACHLTKCNRCKSAGRILRRR
jgi:hypothetical protein